MQIDVKHYPSVITKLREMDVGVPSGLGILPTNFERANDVSEFKHLADAATFRKLLAAAGVPISDFLPKHVQAKLVDNNSADWVVPTLFVTNTLLSQNPYMISIALNVISSYIVDMFRGTGRKPNVKFEIVCERTTDSHCRRITYEGDLDGIIAVEKLLLKALNE